jgi:hypothetical protein
LCHLCIVACRQLEKPFRRQDSHPLALEKESYALKPWPAVKEAVKRQTLLLVRDEAVVKGRAAQVG